MIKPDRARTNFALAQKTVLLLPSSDRPLTDVLRLISYFIRQDRIFPTGSVEYSGEVLPDPIPYDELSSDLVAFFLLRSHAPGAPAELLSKSCSAFKCLGPEFTGEHYGQLGKFLKYLFHKYLPKAEDRDILGRRDRESINLIHTIPG